MSTANLSTFAGPDATLLSAYTPDVGPGWSSPTNLYELLTGKCRCTTTATSTNVLALVESGAADGTVSCDVVWDSGAGNRQTGLAFRCSDASNGWVARWVAITGQMLLDQLTAGVLTTRATFAGSPGAAGNISVALAGTSITVSLDGTPILAFTSAANQAATLHGLFALLGGTAGGVFLDSRWDNYTVTTAGATAFTLTGPASGAQGVASANFTLTPTGGNYTGTITPADAGGGTCTPASRTWAGDAAAKTFTMTRAAATTANVSATASPLLTPPAPVAYTTTAVATGYTLSGPATGPAGAASSNFTVTPTGGNYTGTITPADAGGGTCTPASLTWSGDAAAKTFTVTRAASTAANVSATSSPGITNPAPVAYTTSPVPATAFTLTGPASGAQGVASTNFTLTPTGGVYTGTITPADAGGGTCTPASRTWTGDAAAKTFTVTRAAATTANVSAAASPLLTPPAPVAYTTTAVATGYTLTGPATGTAEVASTNFTLTPTGGVYTGTITPADAGGGTCTPASRTWTGDAAAKTFTVTRAAVATANVSATSSPGITDPAPVAYTTSPAPAVEARILVAEFGAAHPGLATVGYTLLNADGSAFTGRALMAEVGGAVGAGAYVGTATVPAAFDGVVLYDTGGAAPAAYAEPCRPLAVAVAAGGITNASFGPDTGQAAVHSGTARGAAVGSTSTITLDAAASATDNAYTGLRLQIISGPGTGESQYVSAYNGTTKVAAVLPGWHFAPIPNNTSVFVIRAMGSVDVASWRGQPLTQSSDFPQDFWRLGIDGTGGVTVTGYGYPAAAPPTAAEVAAAWDAGDYGNGRTRKYFLQGGFNKTSRTATTFTLYSTDDQTVLAAGPVTSDGSLAPIASVDPA